MMLYYDFGQSSPIQKCVYDDDKQLNKTLYGATGFQSKNRLTDRQ